MEEQIFRYINIAFKVYIDNKEFTAIFRKVDDELGFEINHDGQISYNIINKKINLFKGYIENRKITILTPMINSYRDDVVLFKFDMMLDGEWIDKDDKVIKKIKCSYHGVNEFDLSRCIEISNSDNLKINYIENEYKFRNKKIKYIRSVNVIYEKDYVNINKEIFFEQEYINDVNIYKIIKDIWHLKNLFSIFSKKEISVKTIEVYIDKNVDAILFMNYVRIPVYDSRNEIIEFEEKRFLIHFKDIKEDFKKIYINSNKCFKKIAPLLQIYLDSLEKKMPILNKFLSINLLMEGFSREYFNNESLNEMIINEKREKKPKESNLKYRISFMIKNINFIYNFSESKILRISSKIALGRNYYTHHDKRKRKDQLSNREISKFTYFLEDVWLANIYLQLGINKEIIKEAFLHVLYYDITSL